MQIAKNCNRARAGGDLRHHLREGECAFQHHAQFTGMREFTGLDRGFDVIERDFWKSTPQMPAGRDEMQ